MKNAARYHPGPVMPSTTDGAPFYGHFDSFKFVSGFETADKSSKLPVNLRIKCLNGIRSWFQSYPKLSCILARFATPGEVP